MKKVDKKQGNSSPFKILSKETQENYIIFCIMGKKGIKMIEKEMIEEIDLNVRLQRISVAEDSGFHFNNIRKYFSSEAWEYMKGLKYLIDKRKNENIWNCGICEKSLKDDFILCNYCLDMNHLRCAKLIEKPETSNWCCGACCSI